MEFLKPLINTSAMREHLVEVSNKMVEAIFLGGKEFPEPTRLNCFHPNTQRLFDIRDKFFENEDNPSHPEGADKHPFWGRQHLFEVLWRMLIIKYEHSPYYARRFDWLIEKINESGWKPRHPDTPTQNWRGNDN